MIFRVGKEIESYTLLKNVVYSTYHTTKKEVINNNFLIY